MGFLALGAIPLLIISAMVYLMILPDSDSTVIDAKTIVCVVALTSLFLSALSAICAIILANWLMKPINSLIKKLGESFTENEKKAIQKMSQGQLSLLSNAIDYFSSKKSRPDALETIENNVRVMMANSNDICFRLSEGEDTFSIFISEYWEKTYGAIEIKPHDKLEKYIAEENLPMFRNAMLMAKSKENRHFGIAVRMKINSKYTIWVNVRATSVFDEKGKIIVIGSIIDIDSRRQLEAEIDEKYNMYKFVLGAVPDIIYEVSVSTGALTVLNPDAWYEMFDVDIDSCDFESSRRPYWSKIHPDYREDFLDRFFSYDHILNLPNKSMSFEYRVMSKAGDWIWVEHSVKVVRESEGHALKVIGKISNINERKRRELKQLYQSDHDSLTGTYLRSAIRRKFDAIAGENGSPAIIMIDVIDFGHINDQYGHTIGDMVLRSVTAALWSSQTADCSVARVGGDDFVIMIKDTNKVSTEDIETICRKITDSFVKPLKIEMRTVYVSVAIGIAFMEDGGKTYDEVYPCAEAAAAYSKSRGENRYTFYTEDMADMKKDAPSQDDEQFESSELLTGIHNTTR